MQRDVLVTLACAVREEVFRSRSHGPVRRTRYQTWGQVFRLPDHGHRRERLVCPKCHHPFQLRIYSLSKARRRKIRFALSFFAIAIVGIALGLLGGEELGFLGYSLAAPFVLLGLWHLIGMARGRFLPSDLIAHGGGRVHRIFDDRKISFPANVLSHKDIE